LDDLRNRLLAQEKAELVDLILGLAAAQDI